MQWEILTILKFYKILHSFYCKNLYKNLSYNILRQKQYQFQRQKLNHSSKDQIMQQNIICQKQEANHKKRCWFILNTNGNSLHSSDLNIQMMPTYILDIPHWPIKLDPTNMKSMHHKPKVGHFKKIDHWTFIIT
jgi:hypothetical protein